jgi:hypothetical protein
MGERAYDIAENNDVEEGGRASGWRGGVVDVFVGKDSGGLVQRLRELSQFFDRLHVWFSNWFTVIETNRASERDRSLEMKLREIWISRWLDFRWGIRVSGDSSSVWEMNCGVRNGWEMVSAGCQRWNRSFLF